MSRISTLTAWFVGATASMVVFWYVVVYVFGEFNHGYGQRTWFQLNVYLSMLAVVIGLVGFAATMVLRPRSRSLAVASGAGIAFAACELAFVFAMGWALPDRDTAGEGLAGALVIGALSAFVTSRKATTG